MPDLTQSSARAHQPAGFHAERVYAGRIPSPLRAQLDAVAPGRPDWRYVYFVSDHPGGTLLYIGQTWSPAERLFRHRNNQSPWWSRSNFLVVLGHRYQGWAPSVDQEIADIERSVILALKPAHNIVRAVPQFLAERV